MNNRGGAKSGIFFGLVLVVTGTVLLLERMGLLDTNLMREVMRHLWTLILIVAGGGLILGGRGAFGQVLGVFLVIAGITTELRRYGIVRFSIWDLWPIQLIALGVLMLWRIARPPNPQSCRKQSMESRISEYAVFGGGDIQVASKGFEGGNLVALFGGHEVDLTAATITNSPAVIYADAIAGGVSLKVPPTWRVTTNGLAFMGGIENKTLAPAANGEPEQHLVVKGLAVLGGVEIKN